MNLLSCCFSLGGDRYIKCDECFLFSFANKDHLAPFKMPVYQNQGNALYTNSGYGPTFGSGYDLYIANEANAGKSSYTVMGSVYKPPPGYSSNTVKANNLLAGTTHFTPTDVEVYYFE